MLLSERIKALAPPGAVDIRMVAHLHDERSVVYSAGPSSYFTVGESPHGIRSGRYTLTFFTEQYRPIPHHNKSIHIDLQGEDQRTGQSPLSLHHAGARAHQRPLVGSGGTAQQPLSSSAHAANSIHPARTIGAKTKASPDARSVEVSDAIEDTDLPPALTKALVQSSKTPLPSSKTPSQSFKAPPLASVKTPPPASSQTAMFGQQPSSAGFLEMSTPLRPAYAKLPSSTMAQLELADHIRLLQAHSTLSQAWDKRVHIWSRCVPRLSCPKDSRG